MPIEKYVVDIINGRLYAPWTKRLLKVLSCVYRWGVLCRNIVYDKGWLKSIKAPGVVISIGNIVSGGTSKTPLVHLLVQELYLLGRVAILTRGYRSQVEKSGKVVQVSKENINQLTPVLIGDEPYWLATHLSESTVWVGKDRVKSARLACSQGAQMLILDDGMQFRQLHRDVEIVTMDANNLFGYDNYLPCGLLRDEPCRLRHADFIVLTHVQDKMDYENKCRQLATYTTAPIMGMQLQFLNSEEIINKKVGLFCGIAKPERFLDMVRSYAQVVDEWFVADHGNFSPKQLREFAKQCQEKGAQALVCTEKDAVKLLTSLQLVLPIIILKAKLELIGGKQYWSELIHEVQKQFLRTGEDHERRV